MNFQNQIDYGQAYGIDVLGGVQVLEPLSLDTLKSLIVIRCGLLTPVFSEPETMAQAIATWFSVNAWGISKMVETASTDYLPLENYRRTESSSRNLTRARGETEKEKENTKDGGTIGDEFQNETEKTVSAYNSETYAPEEKNLSGGENTRTIDTGRDRSMERSSSENLADKESEERLTYGNIGTMTTQQMFNEELDLLERFNPYEWIISKFEKDLFLALW